MGRRLVLLLCSLIVLEVLTVGCSKNVNKQVFSSKVYNEDGNAVQKEGIDQLSVVDKPSGVITDTVADVFKEPDTKSERITQAIFNQPVYVLDEIGDWYKVKVVDGYTGWIKSSHVDRDTASIKSEKFKYKIIVTTKTKKILSKARTGIKLMEIVTGTELYSASKTDEWYKVILPGKVTGWISESGTIQLAPESHIPKTAAQDFLATADKFKNAVYLWGGVSAWGGVDASGLTYICSRVNGIALPRDCYKQFDFGTRIQIENIKPGDLVFFNTKEGTTDISYVGIYIGEDEFLYASKAKGKVITSSLKEEYHAKRLAGIRRLFE